MIMERLTTPTPSDKNPFGIVSLLENTDLNIPENKKNKTPIYWNTIETLSLFSWVSFSLITSFDVVLLFTSCVISVFNVSIKLLVERIIKPIPGIIVIGKYHSILVNLHLC